MKSESLAKIIPLGERHLRKAVREYTEHYHLERNHQGLDNELSAYPIRSACDRTWHTTFVVFSIT